MKIMHLSDLHIGLRLKDHDLGEDQEYILNEIAAMAAEEAPDAIVIAGDIYDKAVPSAEAVELFDGFLSRLHRELPETEIMSISGNHDSAPRVDMYRGILSRQHIHMIGQPPMHEGDQIYQVTLEDAHGPVHFYLLPFVKPAMIKEITGPGEDGNNMSYDDALRTLLSKETIDSSERNVLVSHQFYFPAGGDLEGFTKNRAKSERITVGNVDLVCSDVLRPFDYAALGHIHKAWHMNEGHAYYCGTPLACSFSEAGQEKHVLMIDLEEKGQMEVRELPLHPLHQVRVIEGSAKELLSQRSMDYVSIRLTDLEGMNLLEIRDRLDAAFPNLLEFRRVNTTAVGQNEITIDDEEMDPAELCRKFLMGTEGNALDPKLEELLLDVIREVQEEAR